MSLAKVIALLPSLTQAERTIVRAALDKFEPPDAPAFVDDRALIFDAMVTVLNLRISFATFAESSAYKSWSKQAPAVVQFIDETWPGLRRVTKQALIAMMMDSLVKSMKRGKVPVTLGTLANQVSRLPDQIDEMFPDYIRGGLAGLIVKQLEQNNEDTP